MSDFHTEPLRPPTKLQLSKTQMQQNTGTLSIPKRGPGRPKGTTHGDAGVLMRRVEEMYKIIEHMLTPEQQEYYKRAFSGKEKYDPMKHAEFFTLLYGVYANDILVDVIKSGTVSQDVAQTLREYRMALNELENMQQKREKDLQKDDDKLIDPTRKPKESRLTALIERIEREGEGTGSGGTST